MAIARDPLICAMLAAVDFSSPLLWAVFLGWILSVVLHEFSHGIVAHFGGDHTIRQRGGLTLNPMQYIDPVMSIALPAIVFLIGGIPLPGGVTYIRHDLLRGKVWESLVAAAGPVSNLVLFGLLAMVIHPRWGFVAQWQLGQAAPNVYAFVAAMAMLQMLAVILNLIPVPPLDGFGILAPWMGEPLRRKLSTPPLSTILFVVYFMVLFNAGAGLFQHFFDLVHWMLSMLGYDERSIALFGQGYNVAMFGSEHVGG